MMAVGDISSHESGIGRSAGRWSLGGL
jgi:hypothetical protein